MKREVIMCDGLGGNHVCHTLGGYTCKLCGRDLCEAHKVRVSIVIDDERVTDSVACFRCKEAVMASVVRGSGFADMLKQALAMHALTR